MLRITTVSDGTHTGTCTEWAACISSFDRHCHSHGLQHPKYDTAMCPVVHSVFQVPPQIKMLGLEIFMASGLHKNDQVSDGQYTFSLELKWGVTPLLLQVETLLCCCGRLHVLQGAVHCAACCKRPKPCEPLELYLFFSNISEWCFVVFKIGRPETRYQRWRKAIVIEQSKSNNASFYGVSIVLCLWAWWLYQIESMHAAAVLRDVTKGSLHFFSTFILIILQQ